MLELSEREKASFYISLGKWTGLARNSLLSLYEKVSHFQLGQKQPIFTSSHFKSTMETWRDHEKAGAFPVLFFLCARVETGKPVGIEAIVEIVSA